MDLPPQPLSVPFPVFGSRRVPTRRRRAALGLIAAAGAAATAPLWTVPFPPMTDYPQQLALAAILRFYDDPARLFRETYELWWTAPHSLWKLLVAGLAWLLPINTAGKLVVALSLAAVGPAALALCRQAGRPAWYALLPLALVYNSAFYWGFVDNLLAYPLLLAGIALTDRLLARGGLAEGRPPAFSSWLLLAGFTLLFYEVHLQFLVIFAASVGWLAVVRLPRPGRLLLWLSPLLPGLLLAAAVLGASTRPGVLSGYEARMRSFLDSVPVHRLPLSEKLARLPDLLFGDHPGPVRLVLAALLAGTLLVLLLPGRRAAPSRLPASPAAASSPGPAAAGPSRLGAARELLVRGRFASLAGWLGLAYLLLPEVSHSYVLVAERLVPAAAMVAVAALPPARPGRRRLAAALLAGLLVLQLGATLTAFLRFGGESAGLAELLATTEPGQNLAGLIYDRYAAGWRHAPVLLHFPAYYQALKGGRVLFSFAVFYHFPVRFRPGQGWDDLLAEWDDWNPRHFSFPRHGARFRYFLVRGEARQLAAAFGPYLAGLRVRSAGGWYLVENPRPARR
ncbi:MAG TPA: hypothetical protein VHQ90_22180 [Thermoanaerobaculia bacterium]|nr:hypothetical protein [Thermoanaerobaculia bacterium]